LYFTRLAQLKPHIQAVAEETWEDYELGDETASSVDRVLDVRQGQLCWVIGTVFMDMPLKPSVLDDLTKEEWIVAPPARLRYYGDESSRGQVMLEDESGRLQIVGKFLDDFPLCTGCIVAVLGTENQDGAFEIIDIKPAGLPPQPSRWSLAEKPDQDMTSDPKSGKVAIISGLEIDGSSADTLLLDLLVEYLVGDLDDDPDTPRISRLIIAGNSIAHASPIPTRLDAENIKAKSGRKFGVDPAIYNPTPAAQLDLFLTSLLPSIPVTIIPGATDPVGVSLPQQPLHPAFFQSSRSYMKAPNDESEVPGWLDSVSNPWEGEIDGWRILATGGQPVGDMFKYVYGEDRLGMMESFLKWRNVAPTAPDTLCKFLLFYIGCVLIPTACYPFQSKDPFLIKSCPHVFIAGNQPRLGSKSIEGDDGQQVTIIAVPSFRQTGLIALLDMETLEVESMKISL
jgi:DNA polymerase delta subunit 2